MSMSYPHGEKDLTPKLIRFVILLSRLKLDEALRVLPEFSRESYHNDLDRLLEQVGLLTALQSDVFRERQINMQLKAEATHLNHRLAQESLRQRPTSMTEQQQHAIEITTYLQANDFARGQTLAKLYKMNHLSGIIQELQQYRQLKELVYSTPKNTNSYSINFQSLQGEWLRQLVTENSSRYHQTIAFFKSQYYNIVSNLPPSEVPTHLFDQSFKIQYQAFIHKLREMKSAFQDFQRPLKEKIINFSKRHCIQIDQLADSSKCIDHLFGRLDELLEKPQPNKVFYRRSISSFSDIISSGSESSNSFINEPSRLQLKRKRKPIFDSQPEPKMDELYKILSLHLPAIRNFTELSPHRKMEELVKKVGELANEVERIKINDEQFIKSFRITDSILREFSTPGNSLLQEEMIPIQLPNNKSTDELTLGQLKTMADRLARQLEQERSKRTKAEEYNARLVLKLKVYSAKENQERSHKKGIQPNCQATVASLQEEVGVLKEMINKLKQDLEEKFTIINSFEISRAEERKRFEKEKEKLLDSEKARFKRLRDEYDDLMDQLSNLGNLYEERFLVPQKPTPQAPRDSSFTKTNDERDQLRLELQAILAQNHALKQQLSMKKQEVWISIKQNGSFKASPESSESSDSLVKTLNLESKILPICGSSQLQDKISELEFKNEYLANELEKKDVFYNAILDSQTRECSELKEVISTLSREKEQLKSRLRQMEIRSVTHSQQNLPTMHLFPPGGIFEDHDYQERLFLLENLQGYTGPIRRTRLLYRADPHNRANFHKYVDKQRHVVAIFKTIYGRLIAGYSEEAFDASGIVRGHGMILSLWGRKVFELREKRAISYDDYFLIFGNSELRIKTGEFRLFSNFGIANAYYNHRGEKVHAVLGEEKEREVDLSHFQVYALDLEQ